MAHAKLTLKEHFDVTKKGMEKLGNALIKVACVIHYDSFFNYLITYYFFPRALYLCVQDVQSTLNEQLFSSLLYLHCSMCGPRPYLLRAIKSCFEG